MRHLKRGPYGTRLRHQLTAGQRSSCKTALREMQANQCCWCGRQMQRDKPFQWDYETIEHLTPRSLGGTDAITNLALAHRKCNEERGTTDRQPLLRRVARRLET